MTKAISATALVALGLLVAACGSDEEGDPIPPGDAARIEDQIGKIEGQIENGSVGACNDIKKPDNTFDTLQSAVQQLPSRVDVDVRDALDRSIDRLGALVDEECAELEGQEPEETETVTIEEVPEETVPEETVPEETVPEETVPEEEDDGEGKGKGKGKKQEQVPPEGGTEPGEGGSGGVSAPGGGE